MEKRVFVVAALIVPFLLSQGLGTDVGKVLEFTSNRFGFSVQYPASWYRLQTTGDLLTILSFPPSERLTGVVIKPGGAEISVFPAPAHVASIDEWTAEDAAGDVILGRRRIHPGPNTHACKEIVRTVTQDEEGPGKYSISTRYYCSTERGLYQVSVRNWKADPRQTVYERVGLKITLSLRLVQSGKEH